MMKDYKDALVYRAKCLRKFVHNNPELCNEPGVAFWPIPVVMPLIFSKCIYLLQYEIVRKHVQGENVLAKTLTKVRNLLVKLATEGDLGEDHVHPYLEDHSTLPASFGDSYFLPLYQEVIKLNDPFKILGFLYSIEVGSLEFVKTLVDMGLIKDDGRFAGLHLKVEVHHNSIAVKIRDLVMEESFCYGYRKSFVSGCELHDFIYEKIANL